jgi:hypothetical protein
MSDIYEQTQDYGKIDLIHVLKPILEFLEQPDNMKKFIVVDERGERPLLHVLTDKVISEVVQDEKRLSGLRREGRLFSNIDGAKFISTLTKNTTVLQKQNAQLAALEEVIYARLQEALQGQEAAFFGQTAREYFQHFLELTNKTPNADKRAEEIKNQLEGFAAPLRSEFADTYFQDDYPEGKTLLRVPQHKLEIAGDTREEFLAGLARRAQSKLKASDEYDEEDAAEKVGQMMRPDSGWLKVFLDVLEKNAYGRIRRTYACSVLSQLVDDGCFQNAASPAIRYIQRVCDFNELVQNTLPDTALTPEDCIIEFSSITGKGEALSFDVMNEFSAANAFDTLPFWIDFDELLAEEVSSDKITTTMGQHFKLNGAVPTEGFDSVFAYNVSKIKQVIAKLDKGEDLEDYELKGALRVLMLYFVVFWENDNAQEPLSAAQNFRELRKGVNALTEKQWKLRDVLLRIAGNFDNEALQETVGHCERDFRTLLSTRVLDKPPITHIRHHSLYLLVSDTLLNTLKGLENDEPIPAPPNPDHDTTYLRHVKVTRHTGYGESSLLDKQIRIAQSRRYLTLPKPSEEERAMERDLSRQVLGVLLMPKDNRLLYFSEFFKAFTGIVISYERKQLYKPADDTEENQQTSLADLFGLSVARLVYVLLVYSVLKALCRIEAEYRESHALPLHHAERVLFLFLSLYSYALKKPKQGMKDDFTHDAHKAIEYLIRQHVPTKSQGFELQDIAQWEQFATKNTASAKKPSPSFPRMRESIDMGTSLDSRGNDELMTNAKSAKPSDNREFFLAEAKKMLKKEFGGFRANNTLMGLLSGVDALWLLAEKPGLDKIAILTVTSRRCDGLSQRGKEDRVVLFGEIHRFEYECHDNKHYYRHTAPQSFCDEMNIQDSFKNPSVLFKAVDRLYQEGCRDIVIVTKVPFQRRIRMTAKDDSIYVNQAILKELAQQCPEARVYPLFTQKNWGVRLASKATLHQPLFVPYQNAEGVESSGSSRMFRVASVMTYRIVQLRKGSERLHSGMMDYLYRHYPELAPSQSQALAALTQSPANQKCLFEALRFLHAYPYEAFTNKQATHRELDVKLDALENIIGDKSVGAQAEVLCFPKPDKSKRADAKVRWVRVNVLGVFLGKGLIN